MHGVETANKGFNAKKVTIGGTGTPRIIVFLSHSCPQLGKDAIRGAVANLVAGKPIFPTP